MAWRAMTLMTVPMTRMSGRHGKWWIDDQVDEWDCRLTWQGDVSGDWHVTRTSTDLLDEAQMIRTKG